MLKEALIAKFTDLFGPPVREISKVIEFRHAGIGIVIERNSPKGDRANVWIPYPDDNAALPSLKLLEYAGESGRHSNTYAAPGLESGKPVVKVLVEDLADGEAVASFVRTAPFVAAVGVGSRSVARSARDAQVAIESVPPVNETVGTLIDPDTMPAAPPVKPRREAIPRHVQREVWQRDGGRCVECQSRERLCFDHIVPHSLGGANTVRNLQLLCEPCNLSKGNRI